MADGHCAHPGCNQRVADDGFACDEHWSQLPEGLRYRAFGAYLAWRAEPEGERARALVVDAQAQCVEWWRKVPV